MDLMPIDESAYIQVSSCRCASLHTGPCSSVPLWYQSTSAPPWCSKHRVVMEWTAKHGTDTPYWSCQVCSDDE